MPRGRGGGEGVYVAASSFDGWTLMETGGEWDYGLESICIAEMVRWGSSEECLKSFRDITFPRLLVWK